MIVKMGDINNKNDSVKSDINIAVVNGPNINILGIREPDVYGRENWDNIGLRLKGLAQQLGVKLTFFQSNHEGCIVDFIQQNLDSLDGIVINPAAYTKTGYAILDALTSIDIPFVEVHISNIYSRGGWHAESIFSSNAKGLIIGFKGYGYELGLRALYNYLNIKT